MSGTNMGDRGSSGLDSLFDSVPGFENGNDTLATTDNTDAGATETPPTQTSVEGGNGAVRSGQVDRQGSGTDQRANTGTQQPQQQGQQPQHPIIRRHDGLVEQPNANNPRARDLVDPVTGRIVAHGGIERRVFEESQRNARALRDAQTQLAAVQEQLRGTNEVTEAVTRHGITSRDAVAAIQVMSEFKRDPVRTLEYLVSEVKALGLPIPFLEQGVTPGMDMAALQRMIDAKLAPITNQFTQQTQQRANEQELLQRAERELDDFLGAFPYAQHNLDVLQQMMEKEPSLTLHRAYGLIQDWMLNNGYDIRLPLRDQVVRGDNTQSINSPQSQPTSTSQTKQPSEPPLTNGRTVQNTSQRHAPTDIDNAVEFTGQEDWRDILRRSLRDEGYQV